MPSRSEITRSEGSRSWRFANGKICRGREGDLETRPDLYGRLRRVGIHSGTVRDTGRPYMQIECDIEEEDGQLVHAHVGILDDDGNVRSSVAANGLAWGLLQFAPGELMMIEAELSAPYTNPKGKTTQSTYVNVLRVTRGEDGKVRAVKVLPPRADKNGPRRTTLDRWNELEPQIRAHPAYAERPSREEDDLSADPEDVHLRELGQDCARLGWPSPQQAPGEWLAMLGAAFGEAPRPTLQSYDDAAWGMVRQMLAGQTEMPQGLVSAAERIRAAAAPVNRSAFGAAPRGTRGG